MYLLWGFEYALLHLIPVFYEFFFMFVEVCASMSKLGLLSLGLFSGFYSIF
jgi:hypothetical protein